MGSPASKESTMGGFWTSLALRSSDQSEVVRALQSLGRVAWVSPAERGWVTVFDSGCETHDEAEILSGGQDLTRELDTCGLSVLVQSGDALAYWLFDRGRLLDRYESWPEHASGRPMRPIGGDPALLCRVLRVPCHDEDVHALLHELRDHADALFLHESLAKTLGLPPASVGNAYSTATGGASEAVAKALGFAHVGTPRPPIEPARKLKRAPAHRAQLLPFVKPGSATEEHLVELRRRAMDEVAQKHVDGDGVDGFLRFLQERLESLGPQGSPESLRALQSQLPFLEALQRRVSSDDLRVRLKAVEDAIRRPGAG
jgi:hypothetical protein